MMKNSDWAKERATTLLRCLYRLAQVMEPLAGSPSINAIHSVIVGVRILANDLKYAGIIESDIADKLKVSSIDGEFSIDMKSLKDALFADCSTEETEELLVELNKRNINELCIKYNWDFL